ncbi:hypothetical protein FXO38_24064 [Capsicum annuum]|nr:hypothetical protein FXO38_24064 [Capsicum annuum]
MVLHSFQDPHPRVRWAAVHAIHQLLTDFFPYLQAQYHNQILPALAVVMDDLQNPRVQAFAAASIVILYRFESPDTIEAFVDGLLKKLVVLLQNNNQMVHEEALIALGSIADLSKENFHKYYDFVIPHLKDLLWSNISLILGTSILKLCSHPLLMFGERVPESLSSIVLKLFSPGSNIVLELHHLHYSSKLVALQEILSEYGIDFSPFLRSVTYIRLDGSVEREKRFDNVKAFNSDITIDVFQLTKHVGRLCLNLTSAVPLYL